MLLMPSATRLNARIWICVRFALFLQCCRTSVLHNAIICSTN